MPGWAAPHSSCTRTDSRVRSLVQARVLEDVAASRKQTVADVLSGPRDGSRCPGRSRTRCSTTPLVGALTYRDESLFRPRPTGG